MYRMIYKLLLILACCVSSLSYASGNSGYRNISAIKVEGNIGVFVHPNTEYNNPDKCDRVDMAFIGFNDPSKTEKLSLAISAYMGGKKIQSWFIGCTDTPWGFTAPIMYNVVITDA